MTSPMSMDDVVAVSAMRPGEGRWKLIGGEPILDPPPSSTPTCNKGLGREALPGFGLKLSERSRPAPDMIVASEVRPPCSRSRDMRCDARHASAAVPSPWHHVVLRQDVVDIGMSTGPSAAWRARRASWRDPDDVLVLDAPELALPLRALMPTPAFSDQLSACRVPARNGWAG